MIYFLTILFLISLSINVVLFWYCRKIGPIIAGSENMERIFMELVHFKEHIKYILGLEFYQGETRISSLLKHAYDLISFIERYKGVYSFANPKLVELIQEEEQYEEEQAREEARIEDVLYRKAPRGDSGVYNTDNE